MITTVTLNPAIDKTIILDRLKHGEVNRLQKVREDIGGKGINVSKILASLGEENQAIGFWGRKNQAAVEQLLKNQNFKTLSIYVEEATRTNTKVVELETQITTDLNEPGFFVNETQIQEMIALLEKCAANSEYVVISGSTPVGVKKDIYGDMISAIKGKTKVVLDAEGELLLEGLKAGVDIIKPNIHELEGAIGHKLEFDEEVVKAARSWIQEYQLTYILVSMGGNGSLLIGNDIVLKALPIKVEVKGTVGAGDSMLAGFIYGLMHENLEKALAIGAACGTLAVSREGTVAFQEEEVLEMLKRVIIKKL
ncbi:MAG: 1-phosphofructokinase [Lachnospiraceae bacterium]|nr:1-phosphofructokinase [Lachnospiraceae bacterium]